MVQNYLKSVVMEVASQGKPNGDFITVMTARAKAAVRKVVPSNYRLAVRMAIRKQLATATEAVKGI